MKYLDPSIHPLLTDEVLKWLYQKKIFTVPTLLGEPVDKLTKITKLPFKKIIQIKSSLLNKYSPPIYNGLELLDLNSKICQHPVSSSITGLDELLNGGFFIGNVYEICTPAGEGKTQICHTLAAHMKYPVYYLDSKNDFSALRISQINKGSTESLSRINVCYVKSLVHIIEVLHNLAVTFESSTSADHPLQIVILDSVPTHFYALLDTRSNVQGFLSHIGNSLKYLAHKYNCIVITTNLASPNQDDEGKIKIGMGKYWNHIPHVRIMMIKNQDQYIMTVIKSNSRSIKSNENRIVNISLDGVK